MAVGNTEICIELIYPIESSKICSVYRNYIRMLLPTTIYHVLQNNFYINEPGDDYNLLQEYFI